MKLEVMASVAEANVGQPHVSSGVSLSGGAVGEDVGKVAQAQD